MKFGVYLTDIVPRLPIEDERYGSTDVIIATEKPLKLGLIHSNCRSIGPILTKFVFRFTTSYPNIWSCFPLCEVKTYFIMIF